MVENMGNRYDDYMDLFSVKKNGIINYFYTSQNTLCDICKKDQINRPATFYWNFIYGKKPVAYLFCVNCMNQKLYNKIIVLQHIAYIMPVLVKKIEDNSQLIPVFKRPPSFQSFKGDLSVFDVAKLPDSPTHDVRKLIPAFDDLHSISDVKKFVQIGKNPETVVEEDEENALQLEEMKSAAKRNQIESEKRKKEYDEEQKKMLIKSELTGKIAELCGKQLRMIDEIGDETVRALLKKQFLELRKRQQVDLSLIEQVQKLQLYLEDKNAESLS